MNDTLRIPPFVSYACQLCGWCCRKYDVTLSTAEYQRLAGHDWAALEPEMAGRPWVAPLREVGHPDTHRLRFTPEGACAFLGADNKCLMHRHVGEAGKALGCGLFPLTFAFTPTGVYVGCRFSCKSVAYGIGEPLARRRSFIRGQLEQCVDAGHSPTYGDEVVFDGSMRMPWEDYLRLEEALIRVFLRDDLPLVRRLFLAHKFVDVLRQARLERVRGDKFADLVGILEAGLYSEASAEPLPGPVRGIANRMFRQFCFLFQRRLGGAYREKTLGGRMGVRLRTFWMGVQFALNFGAPDLEDIGRVPLRRIQSVEVPPLGAAEELALSRFLAAKLYGKQHFGKLFFDYPVLAGVEFLLLSAGAVLWHARAMALARGESKTTPADIMEAIRYVDFCYGYSRAPALAVERMRVRLLSHDDRAIRLVLAQFGPSVR